MKFSNTLLLASLAIVSLSAFAEEQSPIIVTATRTAQSVDSTLASVTVITKEQIQRQQANDLLDVLSSLAGIDMANSGGFGKATNLYMRGTNTGHVLVMIDGVQVGSATLGQAAYQDIPVDLIERIEIVRGARASLYGSEAIGGVIQIFTRQPTNTTKLNFSSSTGSYNTKKSTAGISGKFHKTSFSVQASAFSTDGYNAKQNNNPDIDGYKQDSANLFIKHEFNNTDSIELSALHSTNVNQYDSTTKTANYYSEGLQQVAGLKGTFNATPGWLITLKANQSKDDSDAFKNTAKTGVFNTKRDVYTWQNDFSTTENNLLTIGVENNDTSVSGTSAYVKKSRNNKALFIQNNWSKGEHDLLMSLRTDDNESFGKHTTGNIAWGQKIFNDTNLVLSAATAFKAPSFNDLYYDAFGYKGNQNILPETSENFEISLKKKSTQVNIYRTNIKNLISWTGLTSPINIGSAKITGIEFLTSVVLGGWDTQLNLSFADPINNADGKILANRSRESLRLDFDRAFSNYALGATIKSQGIRYTSSAPLDSYTLVDLRASYNINKDWALKGKISNAFERKYTLNTDYNTPGKSIFVSIHYNGL